MLGAVLLLNLLVVGWWLGIGARNDRHWVPEVEKLAEVQADGDQIVVRNVRNFEYRSETDFTRHWEERTYDLSKITGVDLFLSEWGAPMIAHTIMSWEFSDGRHLAISIETRKEVGEGYSALLGFFRQFELYYVVADERDVVGVRTNHRGEDVHVYRLGGTPDMARKMLVDYISSINDLRPQPDWYNALTHNCTTSIWRHARHIGGRTDWDWRILMNGTADAMLYQRGTLDTSLPFEDLRALSDITGTAQNAGDAENFSEVIRRGLPRMGGPGASGTAPGASKGSAH